MEEDFKYIEETLWDKDIIIRNRYWVGTRFLDAVENLQTRYKQLEEENNKALKSLENTAIALADSIPKSKVKEKIEELEKDLERDRICIDFVIEHTKDIELKAKIEVLQELLEREGK